MMKVALVHDYLREYGGAERVLEALHQIFPEAPVYTAFIDRKALGQDWSRFADWQIRTTSLAKVPGIKRFFSPLRLWAARAFERLDLSDYDLIISSSNAYMAKAARASKPGAKHVCYCHTPPRVLYGYTAKSHWRERWLTRWAGELINHRMRLIDFRTAQQVDLFLANSKETRARIKKFYKRSSQLIYPPVTMVEQAAQFLAKEKTFHKQAYYLYVNRLAWAKHPELAVQVATDLDLPLKVVGSGAMSHQLQTIAGPSVEFLGQVDDQTLAQLYQGAKALLYPVEDEDFGMVPIEALAWGTPVIAHYSGGPKETLTQGETAVFFKQLNIEALKQAVYDFSKIDFAPLAIHQASLAYSTTSFQQRIEQIVDKIQQS